MKFLIKLAVILGIFFFYNGDNSSEIIFYTLIGLELTDLIIFSLLLNNSINKTMEFLLGFLIVTFAIVFCFVTKEYFLASIIFFILLTVKEEAFLRFKLYNLKKRKARAERRKKAYLHQKRCKQRRKEAERGINLNV